jgi:hypothetical protein
MSIVFSQVEETMGENPVRTLKLHIPTAAPGTAAGKLAERPKSLRGLRVGLLDNGKEFSDVVLDALAEAIRRDYGVTEIRFWRKGFPAKGAPFIAEMAEASDVAISGVGHCGSSSPWSIHDAVNLERAGCPAVALISRSFCPLAQIVARGVAYPALPIVLLPHPIGDADNAKISAKGTAAAPECVRLLTSISTAVANEFVDKKFPLPEHSVARA